MSEQEIFRQGIDRPSESSEHHGLSAADILMAAWRENQGGREHSDLPAAFAGDIKITDARSDSGAAKSRQADWDRAMAAEIKGILATVDERIAAAERSGHKEAQILRVGAEQVTLPTLDHPAIKTPPQLNPRQQMILDALQQKPGIEADVVKDATNVYWIVARPKQ